MCYGTDNQLKYNGKRKGQNWGRTAKEKNYRRSMFIRYLIFLTRLVIDFYYLYETKYTPNR